MTALPYPGNHAKMIPSKFSASSWANSSLPEVFRLRSQGKSLSHRHIGSRPGVTEQTNISRILVKILGPGQTSPANFMANHRRHLFFPHMEDTLLKMGPMGH